MEKLHMDYATIMGLCYYDMQNIIEHYSRILEAREKSEEERAREQGVDMSQMNPKAMMDSAKSSMPKMPNIKFPNFK